MPDEKKTTRPEIFFLPPLKMILTFFDRNSKKRESDKDTMQPDETKEEDVKRIINHLNDKDQTTN